jgi:hypothetical protein
LNTCRRRVFMYVFVKAFVRADMKSDYIKRKILRKKQIHMSFHLKCVLTYAPNCILLVLW